MLRLTPDQLENATWQYINRILELVEDTETQPGQLDKPVLQHALVRLSGFAQAILQEHRLNKRGRCARCRRTNTSRDAPCMVLSIVELYFLESLDVVWWQMLSHMGRTSTLDEVQSWLETRCTDNN